jgi:hypothetical protein
MQRIVNDQTIYMIGARAKCKIGWEATEYWSASICMWWFRFLHPRWTWGLQGIDRAITTCHLPLNHGKGNVFTIPPYPSTMFAYVETTQVLPEPRSYGSIGIGLGHTQMHDEPPPQLSSNSTHTSCMNDEEQRWTCQDHSIQTSLVHISWV